MMEKLVSNGTDSPFDVQITDEQASWISACLNLGAAIGPFIFGNLSDRIGRKFTILGTGIPLVFGLLLMSFARSVIFFYLARFLCGLSTGGVFNVIPVYIGELATTKNRGALSSILNLLLCVGMLFSYCVGPYMSVVAFNLLLAVFPVIFLVLFFIIGPESAYYHIQKGHYDLAKESLQKVRAGSRSVDQELSSIQKKIEEAGEGTFFDIFRSKALKKAFFISLGLMVFQQFSGIIAILYYAQAIFEQAGVNLDPIICSIIIGVVQLGVAFVTPLVVDRLGRKMLLLISSVGMVISEAPIGTYSYLKENNYDVSSISMLPIICLILYIITYNIGYGPLPWTVMGELFPTNVKSAASLFTTFFCWTMAFVVAKYFGAMVASIGMGFAFWIFTVGCVISIPFTYFVLIETKGKTLQDIEEELAK